MLEVVVNAPVRARPDVPSESGIQPISLQPLSQRGTWAETRLRRATVRVGACGLGASIVQVRAASGELGDRLGGIGADVFVDILGLEHTRVERGLLEVRGEGQRAHRCS